MEININIQEIEKDFLNLINSLKQKYQDPILLLDVLHFFATNIAHASHQEINNFLKDVDFIFVGDTLQ